MPAFLDASATVSVGLFGSRRLPELNELYSAHHKEKKTDTNKQIIRIDPLQSGGAKTSSRHLRRRTTAVEKRKHKHRFPEGTKKSSSTTRKARRGKQSTLCQGHVEWQQCQQIDANDEKSTKIHWMVTHLWHAKRFHMEALWGWKVPLCHSNRGARAALRFNDEGRCSLQDVTWKRQSATISSTLPLSTLVPILSRMCPEFAISKTTLCGSQRGSGMIHQLDQFPLQSIGPAQWQVSFYKNDTSSRWVIQWMVHPSIFQELTDCLKALVAERDDGGVEWEKEHSSTRSGFQLCGSSATRIIQNMLRPTRTGGVQNSNDWDWEQLPNSQDASNSLPHGSIVRVNLCLDDVTTSNTTELKDDPEKTGLPKFQQHVKNVQKSIERQNLENDKMALDQESKYQVLLVWQAPRPLDCSANQAVSGWEICCSSPELAKAIWMKLAMAGPCCAIGMAEENHLKLECSPPLPVFPRDYVDTEQGQLYWSSTPNTSWSLVRRIWEGGWGRLPIQRNSIKLPIVNWNSLVSQSSDKNDEEESTVSQLQVVVARGAFAQPFVDALNGCGQLMPSSSPKSTCTRRRKHRQARQSNNVVQAPPLSQNDANILNERCSILRSSLSLPAVLVCHLQVSGRGTIASGATVLLSSILLGFVTAGTFSLKRGSCHGIVVVGAARLLEAMIAMERNMVRIVQQPNKSVQIQLAVNVRSQETQYEGTISIIC